MTVYNMYNISQTVYKQRKKIRRIKIKNKNEIINLKKITLKKQMENILYS